MELMDTFQSSDELKLPENNSVLILLQAGGLEIYCTYSVSSHTYLII